MFIHRIALKKPTEFDRLHFCSSSRTDEPRYIPDTQHPRQLGDASPSIEVAKKIADALAVSLDYLVGEGINSKLDKQALKRLQDLELPEEDKKKTLFDLIDTYIRDAKTRRAHAAQMIRVLLRVTLIGIKQSKI